uniref:EF-hand domain family, member D1 n=1 Tax=Eptatretus burgeri TaxID=7764 RepID=A0A8C4QE97_EPTBU
MASEELARKLEWRRQVVSEAGCTTGGAEPKTGEGCSTAGPNGVPEGRVPEGGDARDLGCASEDCEDGKLATASAGAELAAKLTRRGDMLAGRPVARVSLPRRFCPSSEFGEFSRKRMKAVEAMFKRYDSTKDGYIDLMELKLMMEKLGAPQTHLNLKNMIMEVDEDFDGRLSFREFLLIFHKAAAGKLQAESGLMALAMLAEIDVSVEGVKGAKDFFEAKAIVAAESSRFEAEICAEKQQRQKEEEEKRQRMLAFRQLQAAFTN